MAKTKAEPKKEQRWLVLTDYPHQYEDWFRTEDEAKKKAKELTEKTGRKHLVALTMCYFEPSAKELRA